MNNDNVLPADFDGVFRFTNATEVDFVAKWGGIQYTFPAMKTSPMIIPGATPEEVQNIRKKFAKELAEREFYKSEKLKALEAQTPIGSVGSFRQAGVYTENDLQPYIQTCLEPLPIAQATLKQMPKSTVHLNKDDEGNPVTQVITDTKKSLMNQGTPMTG